jgi:Fic family protein
LYDKVLNALGNPVLSGEQVLQKARFWERHAQQSLSARQVKVLNSLVDGFEGKLTTSKYAKVTKCSQDTAYRDILDLVARGALRKDPGGGRSTSYSLVTGVEERGST